MDVTDVTFELDDDPIREYLKVKLEQIKMTNEKLRKQLQRKKELLNDCIEQVTTKSKPTLEINKIWQKVIDEQLVIGIDVTQNVESTQTVQDIKVTLQEDDLNSKCYSVKCFSLYKSDVFTVDPNPLSKSSKIIKALESTSKESGNYSDLEWIDSKKILNGTITITLKIPDFSEKADCNFEGIISFKIQDNEFQISLPKFSISTSHIYDIDTEISSYSITEYRKEAVLAFFSVSCKLVLIFHLPNDAGSLESIFDRWYILKKIRIANSLYFDKPVSKGFGSLIKIYKKVTENIYIVHLFYKKEKDLEILLHSFYKNIPCLSIIPVDTIEGNFDLDILIELLIKGKENYNGVVKKFGEALGAQVKLIENVLTKNLKNENVINISEEHSESVTLEDVINFQINRDEYYNLRQDLIDLETDTEFLYLYTKNDLSDHTEYMMLD